MNVLVIGGLGYTGSVLVNDLLNDGHQVQVFDSAWFGSHLEPRQNLKIQIGDIRSDDIPMENIDTVFHLANVANDPSVDLAPTLSWEVNVLSTMRVVESAIKSGVKNFVFASSGSVYGVKDEPEVTEDLELVPISVYNKTKMAAERVLLSYKDQIKVWIVRPATVCGLSPRMRLDLSVNLLTFQALKNSKITVFGGDQVRPNIHVDDLSAVYRHILSGKAPEGIYNAGFENISIIEMARTIAERTGAEIVISESNDPRSYRQSSEKLLATGFVPNKGVSNAVEELVEAFNAGQLLDKDKWYTVKSMVAKGLA
jgi:nucleoside-diphosphate-sugar epimerase